MALPSGYKRVEYIQSSGTQYVDSGFKPKATTRVVMDVEPTAFSSWSALFATRNAGSPTATEAFVAAFSASTMIRSDYYGSSETATLSALQRMTVDKNKNVMSAGSVTLTNTESTSESSLNLFLLAMNNIGTAGYFISAKLYSCQIYDNGLLERDFIPCVNASGVAGLWDDVYGVFYGNAGTGAFTAGEEVEETEYTELEYIESDGSQYVDSLFKPNNNTKIKIDFEVTALPASYSAVFSARNSTGGSGAFSLWVNKTGPCFLWQFNTGAGQSTPVGSPVVVGNRVTAENEANIMSVSGVSLTESSATFNGNYSLYVLASNDPGSDRLVCSAKLYSCQIYDNGAEARIYIPMLHPSGVAGLWDSVNNRFYASASTTDLIAGPEAVIALAPPASVEQIINVKLAWTAVEKAQFYRVYRDGELLAETEDTVYVDETAELGQTYVYGITACRSNSESAPTELTVYTREGYAVIRPVVTSANFP